MTVRSASTYSQDSDRLTHLQKGNEVRRRGFSVEDGCQERKEPFRPLECTSIKVVLLQEGWRGGRQLRS